VASVADPTGVPPLSELEGRRFDLADLESLEQTQALLGELGLIG